MTYIQQFCLFFRIITIEMEICSPFFKTVFCVSGRKGGMIVFHQLRILGALPVRIASLCKQTPELHTPGTLELPVLVLICNLSHMTKTHATPCSKNSLIFKKKTNFDRD